MKKFAVALLIVGTLFSASTVNAEIKTYEGVGEYLMSDFETFDVAQQRAKQRAEQSVCEQAGVYVKSRTEVRNAQVQKDEILTMTSDILKIVDVQFKREIINDNTTRIQATVKAEIDSEDINRWLEKSDQERAILVAQNEELRRANAEQDKQIAELKRQLAEVKTKQEREYIKQEIIDKDKKILPNQSKQSSYSFSNFDEIARAIGFMPLHMPTESGFEVTKLTAKNGIAEVRYGRRWEPKVSVTIKTYKRANGEELRDISGVTGVKWRVDTTTGTTIYVAKISETQPVATWAVGHYTFSAQAENLSYAGFHSLVADKLIILSTHYYMEF